MSVADILRECGIVPTVPTMPPKVGTLQTLVAGHVPIIPSVPTEKNKTRAQPPKSSPVSSGGRDRMRAALLTLADRLGTDAAHVHRMTDTDLVLWELVPADALRTYLLALDDAATRQAGKVPRDDTAPMYCRHCGPVWTHPDIAAVLPVVDGWPRAAGCPWCAVRKAGGYIPRPSVTCGDCQRFTPDAINPPAGMGTCGKGHGTHYPMQQHRCASFQPDRESTR